MTYIACVINKNGIVLGSDTRANYFDDYIKNGKIVGKQIKFYWDGNKKIFLIKNRFAIAAQGLLFWGKKRLLLSENIKNFKNNISNQETVQSLASKIHHYFISSKRQTNSVSETMHFLVVGIEDGIPKGFYVNTYYSDKNGIQQLPFNDSKTLYINGDGKGEKIDKMLNIEGNIDFCRNEILKKHKETPFDVGDKLDILVIPSIELPYWAIRTKENVNYKTYDDLMMAIESGNLKVEKLSEPKVLYYNNL